MTLKQTTMDDVRHVQYTAGLAAASRLLAVLAPQPAEVTVRCQPWAPETISITAYAHDSRTTLEAWRQQLGGELVRNDRGARVHWSLQAEIGGVPIELWTLIDVLPVRQRHTEAEQKVCADWIDQHGDPSEWTPDARQAYAATIARMRAGGEL